MSQSGSIDHLRILPNRKNSLPLGLCVPITEDDGVERFASVYKNFREAKQGNRVKEVRDKRQMC